MERKKQKTPPTQQLATEPDPPHPPSTRLPPEILHQIFSLYDLLSPLDYVDSVFDLLAASMVCREWYQAARPLIPDSHIRCPFTNQSSAKYLVRLRRFSSLLSTSQELGLPYCAEVNTIWIAVNAFLGSPFADNDDSDRSPRDLYTAPEDRNALFKILDLTLPTGLELYVGITPKNHPPERLAARAHFLSQLHPYLANVCNLSLRFPPIKQPADVHLSNLVRAAQATLTRVTLLGVPDPLTHEALILCTNVRSAKIFGGDARATGRILCGWRGLRKVRLTWQQGRISDAIAGLDAACSTLEDVYIAGRSLVGEAEASEVTSALESVVSRCERLKYLEVGKVLMPSLSFSYIDDAVLRALARGCRDLEQLTLTAGRGLTGAKMWDDVGKPRWPKLKCLEVENEMVVDEFVERVVLECEALEMVVVKVKMDNNSGVRRALEMRGFVGDGKGCWKRPEA
ncbi:hypothetical protein BC938DRAFT_476903 [Jimgerdemannia flammicorona]|uniref:F-box domain-containing protein n=1 Tax=Jimgerdemannia flammicorona TaxID=994334 RepID=A0A433QYZ6_9FUNG|nr:hypothetical protein BC938DRAFT_476903 [Jimgerdemannia flammicorona]